MNYLRDDINKVLKDRELQIKASGVQTAVKTPTSLPEVSI